VSSALVNFERLLAAGKETALLRFGLGNEYLKAGEAAKATEHFRRAVEIDPGYSAAWKLLGKAMLADHREEEALAAWAKGIEAAERKGDKQAIREMQVFSRRVARASGQE
jgi:Tfp pilus assembly protein PilF